MARFSNNLPPQENVDAGPRGVYAVIPECAKTLSTSAQGTGLFDRLTDPVYAKDCHQMQVQSIQALVAASRGIVPYRMATRIHTRRASLHHAKRQIQPMASRFDLGYS